MSVMTLARELREALIAFDPKLYAGEDCAGLAEELAAAEKACAAARVLVSARAVECGAHRARSFRHWRTDLGMVGFAGELPPEVGLPFVNRLDAEADRLRRQAKRDGRSEERETLAADALLKLIAGAGQGRNSTADLVIVCDLRAYRRGHAHSGEPVHLVDGGPIPVSLVKELEQGAFLKVVLHDGTRIDTVKHFGRHIPAELHTALALGPVPDFDGVRGSAPGCDRRYHLERDHSDPVANGGPTSFANLAPLCPPDHRAKPARDRKAGLLRGRRQPPGAATQKATATCSTSGSAPTAGAPKW